MPGRLVQLAAPVPGVAATPEAPSRPVPHVLSRAALLAWWSYPAWLVVAECLHSTPWRDAVDATSCDDPGVQMPIGVYLPSLALFWIGIWCVSRGLHHLALHASDGPRRLGPQATPSVRQTSILLAACLGAPVGLLMASVPPALLGHLPPDQEWAQPAYAWLSLTMGLMFRAALAARAPRAMIWLLWVCAAGWLVWLGLLVADRGFGVPIFPSCVLTQ
jgi:hypothetical protein